MPRPQKETRAIRSKCHETCKEMIVELQVWKMKRVHKTVMKYKKRALAGTLMGNKTYCETKIVNNTLRVKGNISVFGDKWFDTKDIVKLNKNKEYYFQGRSK